MCLLFAPFSQYNLLFIMANWRGIAGIGCLLILSSCYSITRPRIEPTPPPGMVQRGIASWYGPGFHGKLTSSGEVFDQNKMTAAHRSLPLGSRVLVTNERNGRRVEVTINDRGPFVPGRIVDLSKAAAVRLGMLEAGTAPVRVEVLNLPPDSSYRVKYAVQIASFTEQRRAHRLISSLTTRFDDAYLSEVKADETTYFRVRLGPYTSRQEAEALAQQLAALGWPGVVVEEQ